MEKINNKMGFRKAISRAAVPLSSLTISMLLALFVVGCDSSSSTIEDDVTVEEETVDSLNYLQKQFTPADDSKATVEGIQSLATANNDFAIKMYQQLNQDKPVDNLVFSPYSISSAMMLGYIGASGLTYDEIKQVFSYPEVDKMLPNAARLYNQLNRPSANYSLSSVNELWIQKGLSLNSNYLDNISRYLAGNVGSLDFANDPDLAIQTINQSIAKQTNNLIPRILSKDDISKSTRTVLTNALYFKGAWANEFYDGFTEPMPFRTFEQANNANSESVVNMMHQNAWFGYIEDEQAQILDMPYAGDEIAMIVILPKETSKKAFQQLIDLLSAKKITAWQTQFSDKDIDLYLPKFKMDIKNAAMADTLISMGMPSAFTDGADFSEFSKDFKLQFNKVIHQAVIEVDEIGTEATAATVIEMIADASEEEEPIIPIEFKADHPFIYTIYHKPTGTILFMGQMVKTTD
ncbi:MULTISPECIES: serpin family protein [unclassified Psychrobacter]|uniref:serpin family protein n=1 Tax=unclassified Psychrobacter TaxID=196806 RepID=UPI001EDDA782|nr:MULTISPECIES: serpin family protein [unclassified Psychrobacter]MCG3808199.1 serpin family protein [Psychrobacter sp. Ps4]